MLSLELQNELNIFNQKYSVNFNLEKAGVDEERFADLDDPMVERIDKNVANTEIYYSILRNVLLEPLSTKTRISAACEYSLKDFDFVRFMNEFEELMAQRNAESENPRDRKPFENMGFNVLLTKVKEDAQPYNQSIYGIWASKILNDKVKFTYRDLKAVTTSAMNAIDASLEDRGEYSHKYLINIVYAKEAMEKVRQSRTGWWKFWNFLENYREAKYYDALSKKVGEYIESRYPVGKILENASHGILENAYAASNGDGQDKGKTQEVQAKKPYQSNVFEQMTKVIANPETTNSLVEDIMKDLPEGGFIDAVKRNFVKVNVLPEMFKRIQECNREFDKGITSGTKTANVQMLYLVEKVFDKAFPMPTVLGYDNDKDKIVVAQVITDAVLKKLSPAALNPELMEFTNGYVVNNPKAYHEVTGFYEEQDLIAAKDAYNAMRIERVNVNEAMEPNAPIVQPVANSSAAQPLARGNNK